MAIKSIRSLLLFCVSASTLLCLSAGNNISQSVIKTSNIVVKQESTDDTDTCIHIAHKSVRYFRNRLRFAEPNFIRFDLIFGTYPGTYHPKFTKETFHPFRWYWTYKTNRGLYPYLHWSVDYKIMSFDLLDVKTLWKDPYIEMRVNGRCNLTMGTRNTTELIAEQFKVLVSRLSHKQLEVSQYQESYWCYLAEAPGFRDTLGYQMARYLLYQTNTINYNCCVTVYNFTHSEYQVRCLDEQMTEWTQCTFGPYILGLILFLFCPIIICKATSSSSDHDRKPRREMAELSEQSPLLSPGTTSIQNSPDDAHEENWLYLDGNFPKTFFGVFASVVPDQYPVAVSRVKRSLFLLIWPSIVFIQIGVYKLRMPDVTRELVERGVPMGFLSLLVKNPFSQKSFVPAFGGPIVLLISYYLLGIVFLIFPKSLVSVFENGIPQESSECTPLGLSATHIKKLSNINVTDNLGCRNATNLFLCSFYMLFRREFWVTVYQMQKRRYNCLFSCRQRSKILIIISPLYLLGCLLEALFCVVYFAIPILGFIVVIIRGAIKTSVATIDNCRYEPDTRTSILCRLLRYRLVMAVFSFIVALLFVFYLYSVGMVFIQSFLFVSQILVYCYIAVVIFPTTSFGYLFFVVILLYYIFRLIRGFGAKYLELLSDIVDIVSKTAENDNYLSVLDESLIISNINVSKVTTIKVNDTNIPIPLNFQRKLQNYKRKSDSYVRFRNNVFGVKRDLFDYVVNKHLPVHQQVLKVIFHLSMICFFLLITISLTIGFVTGPTSEMSDVMHVIFVVTVGALPRVLEVALYDSSQHIYRDIKLRRLEETINIYLQEVVHY